jgi:uncharacterized protein YigA (DUF484 family)
MKTRKQECPESEEMSEAAAAAWLRAHPRFFQQHLDLLETLEVPHPSGAAVSLVARQLDLLREKNRKLEAQLKDILRIARDNDALFRRAHKLTLNLMDAASLDDALACLRWLLHECFEADFVSLRLIRDDPECPIAGLCVSLDHPGLAHFSSLLERGEPECGVAAPERAEFLFGADAAEVRSYALAPLQHAGLKGILAIGGRLEDRFDAGMDKLFLSHMSEIVAARFVSLLAGRS